MLPKMFSLSKSQVGKEPVKQLPAQQGRILKPLETKDLNFGSPS